MIVKATKCKLPTYDMTRSFPLTMSWKSEGLAEHNNPLYILYVYVLKRGWNIYDVVNLGTRYEVWIAKQGEDHKCVVLKPRASNVRPSFSGT